jgi:hypothetical protein
MIDIFLTKCRTPNERFGASGAVARLKVCANLQVLRPSERQWKPRLRQAATTLAAIRATARWTTWLTACWKTQKKRIFDLHRFFFDYLCGSNIGVKVSILLVKVQTFMV